MRTQSSLLLISLLVGGCLITVSQSGSTATLYQPSPSPDISVHQVQSNSDRPIRPSRGRYRGSLWDTHVHLDPPWKEGDWGSDPKELLAALDQAGVGHINIMGTPNEGLFDPVRHDPKGGVESREVLRTMANDRVRVFCGAESMTVWMDRAARKAYRGQEFHSRIMALAENIDTDKCSGIGEIGLLHFNKSGHQAVIDIPPTFPPFLSLIEMAAGKGVWIDLHAEPVEPEGKSRENEVFGAIALFYQRHPNLSKTPEPQVNSFAHRHDQSHQPATTFKVVSRVDGELEAGAKTQQMAKSRTNKQL